MKNLGAGGCWHALHTEHVLDPYGNSKKRAFFPIFIIFFQLCPVLKGFMMDMDKSVEAAVPLLNPFKAEPGRLCGRKGAAFHGAGQGGNSEVNHLFVLVKEEDLAAMAEGSPLSGLDSKEGGGCGGAKKS